MEKHSLNCKVFRALAFFLLGMVGFWSGCGGKTNNIQRPHFPWVFRSVLDEQPRMITLALHQNLWLSYSTERCALYQAWKGGVNFDGPVYTTVHGPQPTSVGDIWIKNRHEHPWRLLWKGDTLKPRLQYRGHLFQHGRATLHYELPLPDGHVAHIYESPEFLLQQDGRFGLERIFRLQGLSGQAQVFLRLNLSSLQPEKGWETNAQFTVLQDSLQGRGDSLWRSVDGILRLNAKEPTRLVCYFVAGPTIKNVAHGLPLPGMHPGERLIERSDCKACHNPKRKTIGPGYLEIARKYQTTEANIQRLIRKIREGGSGTWGEAVMSPHPDLSEKDLRAMVEYILSLDAEEESALQQSSSVPAAPVSGPLLPALDSTQAARLLPGLLRRFYSYREKKQLRQLADVDFAGPADYESMVEKINFGPESYQWAGEHFALQFAGYLKVPREGQIRFRLQSDDGARLYVQDQLVIDHDGIHGMSPREGSLALKAGYHPFRLEYFQAAGLRGLSLEWRLPGQANFIAIPPNAFFHDPEKQKPGQRAAISPEFQRRIPGDGLPLVDVHPAYDLSQARPEDFTPMVGGMDFLSDGRLVISTWDPIGGVYLLEGVQTGDPGKIHVKRIASGLAEPLGLKVVRDTIYVLQKQELTRLLDHDGDEIIDEYYTLCNSWGASANFHEFAFGLVEKEGYLYGTLAIAVLPGGASAPNQLPDRGTVFRVSLRDGRLEYIAHGLRTPNGIGIGVEEEIFVTDNQGDWLPSSKLLHVQKGAFYGSRAVNFEATAHLPVTPPVLWLPQDEIGNSPSTPLYMKDGPYAGQMIHGEVTHGGIKRDFVEKIDGQFQGCVFRFTQGLEAGVNRLVWGPDGALYVGGIGNPGNWGQMGKLYYGLQRLKYNGRSVFEMLAVRAMSDGLEIEFTEPLKPGDGWNPASYLVKQWWYKPTADYGGPKLDEEILPVRSANVSPDRKKVFLEVEGIRENHVVYLRLLDHFVSEHNHELWTTEAWYTMNRIPRDRPGRRSTPPEPLPPNTLSEAEKAAGWQLLFDGKTTRGWRNFKKATIGKGWYVEDGTLTLDPERKDGGDIITEEQFENFELTLEWKISPCGNSGIFYRVEEADEVEYVWQSGPEMQVLDNACHPDARIEKHRAGDLYDLIACRFVTVKPAGEWNQVRIVVQGSRVEHWLNGHKVVAFEMWTPEWDRLVANSKFRDMPRFGKARKGHIALQDHGDRVWYRNIKIRRLP